MCLESLVRLFAVSRWKVTDSLWAQYLVKVDAAQVVLSGGSSSTLLRTTAMVFWIFLPKAPPDSMIRGMKVRLIILHLSAYCSSFFLSPILATCSGFFDAPCTYLACCTWITEMSSIEFWR
eukprot:Lithocolla_globosa_v1_NODE_199_length_5224_cov_8.409618.p5 type:complete len:121 gc:universal NODE_199_length_5224_cov_8.409618:570-932(+)